MPPNTVRGKTLGKQLGKCRGAQGAAMDPGHSQPTSHRDAEILLLRGCEAHS